MNAGVLLSGAFLCKKRIVNDLNVNVVFKGGVHAENDMENGTR